MIVIDSSGEGVRPALREAWTHRVLAGFLVWRDLKVRYKQSSVGALWAVIQPISLTLVFAVFLGRFANIPSGGQPYWLMALTGIVPFTYFTQAVSGASTSLIDNAALVAKVYFPRLLLPVASAASTFVDALLATLVMLGAAAASGAISWRAPLAVLVPVLVLGAALSFGFWFAAINIRYRDVKAALPLVLQLWLFATPVAYPLNVVPGRWRLIYALNPMVGIVELERWLVFGAGDISLLAPGMVLTAVLLGTGVRYYLRSARWFADII